MLLLNLPPTSGLLTLAAGVSGSGLLGWLWYKSRDRRGVSAQAKKPKSARPGKTGKKQPGLTFFKPTAGKIKVRVDVPQSGYNVAELLPVATRLAAPPAQPGQGPVAPVPAMPGVAPNPAAAPLVASPISATPAPTPVDQPLDDPAFAPAPDADVAPTAIVQAVAVAVGSPDSVAPAAPTTGFQLRVDRQLLSRLLSDDGLCGQFEHYRNQTLTLQRDTGRHYADLFRELIAEEPTDTQAVLLNLLTEDEVADYQ